MSDDTVFTLHAARNEEGDRDRLLKMLFDAFGGTSLSRKRPQGSGGYASWRETRYERRDEGRQTMTGLMRSIRASVRALE